ncbi:hypothetical protein BU52_10005 [Streptomyces toyocaensis]|uniref:Uncharacterized protein n=1 Tax=Streptomyces toyocaensis TaxID=55952 RepID=A0A081XUV6_STRTO|nr:hypothetical protein [Streptomyces toyocaensis]KES07329.1 hypothetical protein BU52_10005 [Streptomyces toyocaensis]
MSDALQKAEAAAREAAANTADVTQIVAAVLAAQQATQQPPACQHQHPAPKEFDARKWLVVGGVCIAGGLVASLFAVAVAIGSVSVAILALVLRGMWADFQRKGR